VETKGKVEYDETIKTALLMVVMHSLNKSIMVVAMAVFFAGLFIGGVLALSSPQLHTVALVALGVSGLLFVLFLCLFTIWIASNRNDGEVLKKAA
jgi:hypothetical protein